MSEFLRNVKKLGNEELPSLLEEAAKKYRGETILKVGVGTILGPWMADVKVYKLSSKRISIYREDSNDHNLKYVKSIGYKRFIRDLNERDLIRVAKSLQAFGF